jgi:hypothetical protein
MHILIGLALALTPLWLWLLGRAIAFQLFAVVLDLGGAKLGSQVDANLVKPKVVVVSAETGASHSPTPDTRIAEAVMPISSLRNACTHFPVFLLFGTVS